MSVYYRVVLDRIVNDSRNKAQVYCRPVHFSVEKVPQNYQVKFFSEKTGKSVRFDFSTVIEDDAEVTMIVEGFYSHYYPLIAG